MSPSPLAAVDPYDAGDLFLRHFIPGNSQKVRELRAMIYRLNVVHRNKRMVPSMLLLGEPGVGKGFTARAIAAHRGWLTESKGEDRAPSASDDVYKLATRGGIRVLTLTAMPETLAEAALFGVKAGAFTDAKKDKSGLYDCDTPIDVFLDEIGDATPGIQGKLLEVLETSTFRPLGSGFDEKEKQTQARTIAATNRDLPELIEARAFRRDLYERLLWAPLELPPLREQLDELKTIAASLNRSLCMKYALEYQEPPDEDLRWCQTYSWPGNHRELQQVLWYWHVYDRKPSLKSIVERRGSHSLHDPGDVFTRKLFARFDSICAGKSPGFASFGDLGAEMRTIAYAAIYRYNQDHKLRDEDLKKLFTGQDPTNVRKQISENRPSDQKK